MHFISFVCMHIYIIICIFICVDTRTSPIHSPGDQLKVMGKEGSKKVLIIQKSRSGVYSTLYISVRAYVSVCVCVCICHFIGYFCRCHLNYYWNRHDIYAIIPFEDIRICYIYAYVSIYNFILYLRTTNIYFIW